MLKDTRYESFAWKMVGEMNVRLVGVILLLLAFALGTLIFSPAIVDIVQRNMPPPKPSGDVEAKELPSTSESVDNAVKEWSFEYQDSCSVEERLSRPTDYWLYLRVKGLRKATITVEYLAVKGAKCSVEILIVKPKIMFSVAEITEGSYRTPITTTPDIQVFSATNAIKSVMGGTSGEFKIGISFNVDQRMITKYWDEEGNVQYGSPFAGWRWNQEVWAEANVHMKVTLSIDADSVEELGGGEW